LGASHAFQAKLEEFGMTCSMSRKGNCWDNAVAESFFNSLKNERVHDRRYATRDEARADLFDYIEVLYNRRRRHSALEGQNPNSIFEAWQRRQEKLAA
jgi:putative transposase